MKWKIALVGLPLVIAAGALMQAPPAGPAFSRLAPPGALLYIEARDFAGLLRDWNSSNEKRLWLGSDNYEAFSRSRLFMRLGDAQNEFAQAAGAPPDMALLQAVAGGESALALYDIGSLEFVYITRLAAAAAMQNVLWQSRAKFQPRNAAGQPYYVRTDPASHRTAAFAAANGYLLLATREDLIAGSLTLIAGQQTPSLAQEAWFDATVRAAGAAGELRMLMNFDRLVAAPHFRSYWIQRNLAAIRQYSYGISDIRRSPGEMREDRVLLRKDGTEHRAPEAAPVRDLLRLVPAAAGLYRAWAAPAQGDVADLIERKVLAPRLSAPPPSETAPAVALRGPAGSEADLETRIDEAPLENTAGSFAPEPLLALVRRSAPSAMLHVESTRPEPGNIFRRTDAVIVLSANSAWDAGAAGGALLDSIRSMYSTSNLGLAWIERMHGTQRVQELDSLQPLAFAVQDRLLFVSNSGAALAAVMANAAPPSADAPAYAAGFRHARERANFMLMMRMIERPQVPPARPGAPPAEQNAEPPGQSGEQTRQPAFFTDNVGSLSRALARLDSVSITVLDRGASEAQAVVYRLSR